MALNIFGAPPDYLSGLLGVDPEKLRKQAMTTGLINTALAFAAQPRNQNYGSALPYAARALMAGQQGAQGVYQGAMQDAQVKQQMDELKRKQEQDRAQQELLGTLTDPRERLFAQLAPKEFVSSQLTQPKEKARLLTTEEQIAAGLPEVGRYQQKADGTVDLIPGTAPKESAAPSAVQEYQFAKQEGFKGSFQDWKNAQKPQGVTVNVGGQGVAPKKIDEKFADQFIDWTVGGGFSDVQKSLTQLESAASKLETAPEGSITGKVIGVTSPAILKLTNPEATATKESVEEIVQRNLRLILGAQFTEKEGERLIARAYNPALSQQENARRVRLLQQQIFEAAKAKQDAVEYYNQNGTIYGWQGKLFNSTNDFLREYENRIKTGAKQPNQPQSAPKQSAAPQGVDPRVWNKMTPEEKALWQN
jgi:hypothetical protein